MDGGIIPGREFVRGGRPVKRRSLPVSSELLNMLLHVTPGLWWTGEFFRRREFVRGGCPGGGEFIGSSSVTSSS